MADVVFPVETCFEQEGHYINLEGRVQQAHRSITPPSGVESNTNVLMMLAKEMGVNISIDWETKLAPAQVS
jgi:formate dehydrogenase major subunit